MCIIMASSISSQFSNMDPNEAVFAEFIKEKIEKAGGQIKFQHITGHLSQLSLTVRETVGASPRDLKKFLTKHQGLFTVDPEGFVSFQKSPAETTEKKPQNSRTDKPSATNDSDSCFPTLLKEVPGIVIKVLPAFGFISVKHPVKTSVYFTPAVVYDDNRFKIQDEKGSLLTDMPEMLPGKKVLINARKANTNFEAKYRATRVWTPPNVKNQVLVPDGFKPKVPKDGLYDPVSIEGSGRVQKVFEQFGFITNENPPENIFFHKSKVCNVENIMNLAKVFSPGDLVEFKAIRSTKKDIKVKWEASKVWIKKQGKTNLFKKDSGSLEGDSQTQKSVKPSNSSTSRNVLDNLPGKIFPHNDGIVIKFGKNDIQLADADSCPVYLHGAKVQDVCWEFSDGDSINFDAIKIRSAPGFKAVLAWVGVKPNVVMPVHVGDFTEFSDDENVSVAENRIPDKKPKVIEPNWRQPKREQYAKSSDRSRTFTPSSHVSNSRPVSKSRSSVDKDFDLESEDTLSTLSGETQSSGRIRKRHRRSRNNASKPNHSVNSYSSLTDDTALDSEDSNSNHGGEEFHNSNVGRNGGWNSVPDSLTRASSFDSLVLKANLKPNPDVFRNWGDSPYLEEDNSEACSASKEKTDAEPTFKNDNPVRNKVSNQLKSLKEMFPSDDESSDAEEKDNPVINKATEKVSSQLKSFKEMFPPDDKFSDTEEKDIPVRKEATEKVSSKLKSLKEMFPSDDEFSDAEEKDNSIINKATEKDNSVRNTDTEKDNSVRNKATEKVSIKLKSLKEMFPSDDEFSDAEENFKGVASEEKTQKPVENVIESPDMPCKDDSTLPAFEDIMNSEKETATASKLTPCVKCFFNLKGKILKVFCKYAEIEHSKLRNDISVLWSEMYHNGVPVADKFDDMKEVIKPGQIVDFNCIEIIDDDGSFWQKVTAAWKGQKPKIKEMTAMEYIKQNFLKVSIDEKDFDYGDSVNPALAKIPPSIAAEPAAPTIVPPPPRKFLSIKYTDEDEKEPDVPSPVRNEIHQMNIEVAPPENNELDSLTSVEEKEDLTEAVVQMLSIPMVNVDLTALATNIINLVNSKSAMLKSDKISPITMTNDSEPEDQSDISPLKHKKEMKESDTQTIITGDVIAQSIFTMGD